MHKKKNNENKKSISQVDVNKQKNKKPNKTGISKKIKLPKFEYKNLFEDDLKDIPADVSADIKADFHVMEEVPTTNPEGTALDTKNTSKEKNSKKTNKPDKKEKSKTEDKFKIKTKDKSKKEAKDKPKNKFNKRSFVSLAVLFVLGISSGLFAGNWYAENFIAGPATDYSQFTEAELRVGNEKIANDYASRIPTANDAWKSFIAAENNFSSATSFDILSNGIVDTIVTQSVYSRKIFDGEKVFIEQISDGIVAVADRFIYTPSKYILEDASTHIVRAKGKLSGTKTIEDYLTCNSNCKHGNKNAYVYNTTYDNSSATTMTEEEYLETLGSMPLSPIPYIISKATVLSCENFNIIGSGEDARYTFTINLHSGASVLNYVKQMKTVSGLSSYPNFTEVTFNVSLQMLNGKVMFDYICITEKYSVAYGSLTPKCTGTLHQRFLFNGDYNIPA